MHSKASFKRLKRPLGSRVIGFARVGSKRVSAIGIGLLLVASGALAQQAAPVPPVIIAVDGVPVHDFTGLPLTADGWTDLHAMSMSEGYSDARIVYVSTSGSDSTAQVYNQSSAPLGGQPLNPSGQIAPFRTLNAAYDRLRNGYPDVMLLRRGDSWGSTSLFVNKTGRNNAERMIVGAYGPESVAQPIARIHSGSSARDVVLSSARITFSTGTSLTYDGTNVLVEDFAWESPARPATSSVVALPMLHGTSGGANGGGTVRRSSARWIQLFAGWSNSLATPSRVEENTISRTNPNNYSNVYFSEHAANIQSIGNQSLLSNNRGWRQRRGGFVRENMTLGALNNQWGAGFDVQGNTTFERNLGLNIPGPQDVTGLNNATVSENIFTAYIPFSDGTSGAILRLMGDYQGFHNGWNGATVFSDNIFYSELRPGALMWQDVPSMMQPGASITFTGNHWLKGNGGAVSQVSGDSRITYQNQKYFSSTPTGDWFSGQTYAQMIPSTGTGVSLNEYPDPSRDIVTYMRSLGANPSSVEQAIDWYSDGVPGNPSLAGALANRRGAWDERFTSIAVINYIREGFALPPL